MIFDNFFACVDNKRNPSVVAVIRAILLFCEGPRWYTELTGYVYEYSYIYQYVRCQSKGYRVWYDIYCVVACRYHVSSIDTMLAVLIFIA